MHMLVLVVDKHTFTVILLVLGACMTLIIILQPTIILLKLDGSLMVTVLLVVIFPLKVWDLMYLWMVVVVMITMILVIIIMRWLWKLLQIMDDTIHQLLLTMILLLLVCLTFSPPQDLMFVSKVISVKLRIIGVIGVVNKK